MGSSWPARMPCLALQIGDALDRCLGARRGLTSRFFSGGVELEERRQTLEDIELLEDSADELGVEGDVDSTMG
jgi:hypothetical protein